MTDRELIFQLLSEQRILAASLEILLASMKGFESLRVDVRAVLERQRQLHDELVAEQKRKKR